MIRLFTFLFLLLCSLCHAYEKRIALICDESFRGEYAFAHRIKAVAEEKLNWKADLCILSNFEEWSSVDYDIAIHLVPNGKLHSKAKNYLSIFHPSFHYFKSDGTLKPEFTRFEGYLLTYTPKNEDRNFRGPKSLPWILWYPTVQDVEYKEVDPSHLFYLCSLWGNRIMDSKYKKIMELLDGKSYARCYGDQNFRKILPKTYQGTIPYDADAIIETISDAGVYLLLHSDAHNKHGVPSGRIFEAAASSAVIIADMNPFVVSNFGDSILYIDVSKSRGKSIFKQIDKHMAWIQANRQEALKMAQRSHQVFKENFLLEKQLLRLRDWK